MSTIAHKGTDFFKPLYKNDGTGRDGYINLDGGGLMKLSLPSTQINGNTGFYVGNDQRGYHKDKASGHLKTVNYIRDGTGRDTYIADFNGGFFPEKSVASYAKTF